ncbi:MAG: Tol-Pal system beta propeller repeat protein TolB [Candidatus Aminicenantes bacterium]|nr:Tol-Pal system beta propeller repeat protein TolB [Candidatus Aminicenantes bacterium]
MKKTIPVSAVFLALFLITNTLIPQQEVVMRIREGMPIIPVAIPEFLTQNNSPDQASAASTLREVIISDLEYSRVFKPLPEDYYQYIDPLNLEDINFKKWESIEAKLLLSGQVSENRDGSLIFEAKTYDVKSARFIKGKKYQSDPSLLRLVGHKISNEFMKIYGEPPIFTTKIVFVSNRNGNDELYMMDYDGYNQTRLTFNKTRDYMPAWSTDGKTIAYTAYNNQNAALYLFNPFEGTRTLVTDHGTSFGADFSFDGKKMAFCSTEDESNSEIYISDTNGKNIRRLTFNNAIDTAPSWSPNNREIAFTSDRLGSPQIYIMDAEGANIRRRSFGGNYHDAPAWAPTGDRIIYVSRVAAVFDLYVLNLRTDRIIKLTEGYSRNESPSWSPDGRHIVFSSNRTGTIHIYTIDYDGTNLRRLTSRGENKLPNWSRK